MLGCSAIPGATRKLRRPTSDCWKSVPDGLKATGTHGSDVVYSARVSSSKALQLHEKVKVTFRLGDSKPVQRFVKLFAPGEHG